MAADEVKSPPQHCNERKLNEGECKMKAQQQQQQQQQPDLPLQFDSFAHGFENFEILVRVSQKSSLIKPSALNFPGLFFYGLVYTAAACSAPTTLSSVAASDQDVSCCTSSKALTA